MPEKSRAPPSNVEVISFRRYLSKLFPSFASFAGSIVALFFLHAVMIWGLCFTFRMCTAKERMVERPGIISVFWSSN